MAGRIGLRSIVPVDNVCRHGTKRDQYSATRKRQMLIGSDVWEEFHQQYHGRGAQLNGETRLRTNWPTDRRRIAREVIVRLERVTRRSCNGMRTASTDELISNVADNPEPGDV